jgi:hypothetical protein
MSQSIFSAAVAMVAAALSFAAPAYARVDAGPISSYYENDGRASVKRAQKKAYAKKSHGKQYSKKQYGKKQYGKKQYRGSKTAAYGKKKGAVGRQARLAGRAVTASHSGGGGGGASRGCLQASARALLGRIEAQFGAVNVISTCRPGARIAGSGKPSKHGFGLAVDFEAGGRKAAIVNWLRANHHAGGTMTYARMSHIHVDIGPRFVSLGSGGGRRRG